MWFACLVRPSIAIVSLAISIDNLISSLTLSFNFGMLTILDVSYIGFKLSKHIVISVIDIMNGHYKGIFLVTKSTRQIIERLFSVFLHQLDGNLKLCSLLAVIVNCFSDQANNSDRYCTQTKCLTK